MGSLNTGMRDMPANEQLDRLIAEQSSEWIDSLRAGSAASDAAFGTWLLESKRHVRHFLMMAALDRELVYFDPEKRLPIPRLRPGAADVVSLNEHAAPIARSEAPGSQQAKPVDSGVTKRASRSVQWWSLAAVFVSALAVLLTVNMSSGFLSGWQKYSTALGEQRVIELQDGSVVHLNTQSTIAVRLSGASRDIRLLNGEAMFTVHQDASRPFRVHTLGGLIQAIGTQFNVYRRAEGTTVAVLEGRVRISAEQARAGAPAREAPYLAAGEEAKIDEQGHIDKERHADVKRATAWRERRLVFKQEPLEEIVTQFNRYNRVPQFTVVGAAVAARRYSGAFNADDTESLSALLGSERDLVVERSGEEIIIRARPGRL